MKPDKVVLAFEYGFLLGALSAGILLHIFLSWIK